jgi:hypothetical protein
MKKRPSKAARFTRALSTYLTLHAERKAIDETLTEVKATLLQCAADAGGKIDTPTHSVRQIETERKTLSKDKLLALGVTPTQILTSTKVTPVVYVRVIEKTRAAA